MTYSLPPKHTFSEMQQIGYSNPGWGHLSSASPALSPTLHEHVDQTKHNLILNVFAVHFYTLVWSHFFKHDLA